MEYTVAIKQARLVERTDSPNGINLVDPLRVSAHVEEDIISLATQIQEADKGIKSAAAGKLSIVLNQIKALQAEAKRILEETARDEKLHNAACNFIKKPGNVYHLYEKDSGQRYFGMLSPEEWNGSCSHKFIGSFRLENDLSWTPVDKLDEKNETLQWAENLLRCRKEPNLHALEYGNS